MSVEVFEITVRNRLEQIPSMDQELINTATHLVLVLV